MDSSIPTAVILECMPVFERIRGVPLVGFREVDTENSIYDIRNDYSIAMTGR